MEALALSQQQQLQPTRGCTPLDMAGSLESSFSFEDSDVLMIDPYIEYINDILMSEGMDDDAACLQQADGASHYQAIFSSLQDMIGDDSAVFSHADVFDPYQSMYCLNQNGPDAYRVQVAIPHDGLIDALHSTTGPVPPMKGRSAPEEVAARLHHSATKVNINGVLTDVMAASRSGKDAGVEGPRGHVMQEQPGNGAKSNLTSADEQVPSSVASEELELSFEDLNLGDVYTSLYVEESSSSTTSARSRRHDGVKKRATLRKGSACEKQRSEGPDIYAFDVMEVLVSCAEAVAIGDVRTGSEMLREIHKVYGASADGTALQRIAYIFSKALAARMRGTGVQEFEAMSVKMPSSAAGLRALRMDFKVSPYKKIMHYFANYSILKVAEGASKLHIVDFGLSYGVHWACLINALADREGGPPLLVITGIEYSVPGIDMAERLVESGQRLAAYAKTHNVPFQYHAIVSDKWEDLDAASLHCSEAEVLVVNFSMCLRYVPDDSTDLPLTISARQKLLSFVHSLNPYLLITVVMNGAHNSPFFVSRFREALLFYSSVFDTLAAVWGDIPERLIMDRAFWFRCIMNVVACEGAERVERPETFKQWHARITKAGFEQLPVPSTILARSKSHAKQHFHEDILIHCDGKGWMLMGWKGLVKIAMSTWRPRRPQ